jgi:hypothetical protein
MKIQNRDHQEHNNNKNFRIDWQAYNTDDPTLREERIDVSPAGTEGIFIDPEAYIYDDIKK